jgi:hypothetical protein
MSKVKKTTRALIIGMIVAVTLLAILFINNFTSSDGYVVGKKSTDQIWVISADNFEEAIKISKENSGAGMIFIDMNEKKVNNIKVGQQLKVYHPKQIYASAPGQVKPLLIIEKD